MSSHHATADVWIDNLDSENEAGHIEEIITEALRGAGYHNTVNVTVHAYGEQQ